MSFDVIKGILDARAQSRDAYRWGKEMMSLQELCDKSPAAYLFEFTTFLMVACELVDALDGAWQVNAPRNHSDVEARIVWPLAPGLPDTFSYLSCQIDSSALVIRPGVEAAVPNHETTVSPDVSLRLSVGNSSSDEIVIQMWDAKYRDQPSARITRSELFTFASEVNLLVNQHLKGICNAHCYRARLAGDLSARLISHSAIITNGRASTEPESLLVSLGVVEVSEFALTSESFRGPDVLTAPGRAWTSK